MSRCCWSSDLKCMAMSSTHFWNRSVHSGVCAGVAWEVEGRGQLAPGLLWVGLGVSACRGEAALQHLAALHPAAVTKQEIKYVTQRAH